MSRKRGAGSIYRQPGCGTWTIAYYRNGRKIREATGFTDYQAARQKLNQRLAEVATGTYAGPKMERIRVSELADDFLRDQRINSRKSYGHATSRWALHLKPFFQDYRAIDVSSALVARYVDSRLEEKAEPATINRELSALRRMFRLGYYATPPMVRYLPKFPRLQENNIRAGFVEAEQWERLTDAAADLWLRALIELAHTYGWRKRELLGLRVRQVNLKARTIRLEPGTTKNRDGREVAMTVNVHAMLTQCIAGKGPDAYVFTRENGKPVRDFRETWAKVCTAAGCPGLLLHDLRRSAARNFRRAGVAEGVIMRVGGWRTRSVFERYNIISQADIKDALAKLEQSQQANSENGHDFGHDSGSAHHEPDKDAVN